MGALIQYTLQGLAAGGFYALAALGLAVIFGVLGVVNFSHGACYMLGAIIVGVLTFVGFILCILPGIAVGIFVLFWGYFLVDKNMSPIEAITASFNLVKDNFGTVFVFWLLTIVATIVGAIICGVGLIVAIPVVVIATGYMYKRLQGEPVAA